MSGVSLHANETLESTLNTYGNTILRLAYSCLKNKDDAEEVLQDVMLKFFEKDPVFESEEHKKAWLIRVTINYCRNRLRSPWRQHRSLDEANSFGWSEEAVQNFSPPGEESEVLSAVLALPEKYREVIHMFYYEDYSTVQIASILRKKESTVRSLLHRAREMLKDSLKEGWQIDE